MAGNWAHVPVACPERAKISATTTNVIAQIRFANELGRRDYVTGEMWKNKPPIRLCLNEAASTEIIWHCKHHTGRGVMKYYESGEALAKDMGEGVNQLIAHLEPRASNACST